jgi:hypothetical protein
MKMWNNKVAAPKRNHNPAAAAKLWVQSHFHPRFEDGEHLVGALYHLCDFTHFFAAPALITLPQGVSFEHTVGNEKRRCCGLFPYNIAASSNRRHTSAASRR